MKGQASLLQRTIGSMWFGALLLVILLVAMGCATIFESTHGAEHALAAFYTSWWFKALLYLLGVNVLAAMAVRFPFSRRQIGFVLTHVSILAIFAGALVTICYVVDGSVGILEGQTVSEFMISKKPTLTVLNKRSGEQFSIELDPKVYRGFDAVSGQDQPVLMLGEDGSRVVVSGYLPDSQEVKRMLDDNSMPRPAIEVSLSPDGREAPVWVFAGSTTKLGSRGISYRTVPSRADLLRLVQSPDAGRSASKGSLKIEYAGRTYEMPIEDCMKVAVPLGDTDYTVRVLRYLPHASVGPDNEMINISQNPTNPFIEAEIVGPDGTEKRMAFAKFPEFASMHQAEGNKDIKLTFVALYDAAPIAPIDVIGGPGGDLYVRFDRGAEPVANEQLTIGQPVETPWVGQQFSVLRRFERARFDEQIEPVLPVRKKREPAILAKLIAGEETSEAWIQKYSTVTRNIDGVPHEISFSNLAVPLGFEIKLDRFKHGRYPGTNRSRSFESHITITGGTDGHTESRIVSMNRPVEFGGYTLYQSSYRQERGQSITYLSVSRDPGQLIVFAGYIGMLIGMVWVLVQRMTQGRKPDSTSNDVAPAFCGTGFPPENDSG